MPSPHTQADAEKLKIIKICFIHSDPVDWNFDFNMIFFFYHQCTNADDLALTVYTLYFSAVTVPHIMHSDSMITCSKWQNLEMQRLCEEMGLWPMSVQIK